MNSEAPETPTPSNGTDQSVNVENAQNVNVPQLDWTAHPAIVWLVAFVTVGVLLGFGGISFLILTAPTAENGHNIINGVDPATKGAVIQTWNNLAVAAAAVWTTSSVVNRLKGQH
jgi:hypothetical protein